MLDIDDEFIHTSLDFCRFNQVISTEELTKFRDELKIAFDKSKDGYEELEKIVSTIINGHTRLDKIRRVINSVAYIVTGEKEACKVVDFGKTISGYDLKNGAETSYHIVLDEELVNLGIQDLPNDIKIDELDKIAIFIHNPPTSQLFCKTVEYLRQTEAGKSSKGKKNTDKDDGSVCIRIPESTILCSDGGVASRNASEFNVIYAIVAVIISYLAADCNDNTITIDIRLLSYLMCLSLPEDVNDDGLKSIEDHGRDVILLLSKYIECKRWTIKNTGKIPIEYRFNGTNTAYIYECGPSDLSAKSVIGHDLNKKLRRKTEKGKLGVYTFGFTENECESISKNLKLDVCRSEMNRHGYMITRIRNSRDVSDYYGPLTKDRSLNGLQPVANRLIKEHFNRLLKKDIEIKMEQYAQVADENLDGDVLLLNDSKGFLAGPDNEWDFEVCDGSIFAFKTCHIFPFRIIGNSAYSIINRHNRNPTRGTFVIRGTNIVLEKNFPVNDNEITEICEYLKRNGNLTIDENNIKTIEDECRNCYKGVVCKFAAYLKRKKFELDRDDLRQLLFGILDYSLFFNDDEEIDEDILFQKAVREYEQKGKKFVFELISNAEMINNHRTNGPDIVVTDTASEKTQRSVEKSL